jgi:uncharacterized membrane protein YphA (DoxX/SURF4 family)
MPSHLEFAEPAMAMQGGLAACTIGMTGRSHDLGETSMPSEGLQSPWKTVAILVGRLIFAGVFIMAVSFKFMDMGGTASYIASAGFPVPLLLAWCAALFECALILCFLTGAFFSEAALLAAAYVLFLGFAFHGPGRWAGNQAEFGFFVDHFTFFAGLLFAAVNGPGRLLVLDRGFIGRT